MERDAQNGESLGPDDPHALSAVRAGFIAGLTIAISKDPLAPATRIEHVSTLAYLARDARVSAGGRGIRWDRFSVAATALVGEDDWGLTVGVMANMIALVDLADASDFTTASALVEEHGHRAIAAVQTGIDGLIGTGPTMPLATRMVQALTMTDSIADILTLAGSDRAAAVAVAEGCFQTGVRLVLAGVDRADPGPILTTPEEVAQIWDGGGIPAWRQQMAIIADNPWAPYSGDLAVLARAADRPVLVAFLVQATKIYKDRLERHERDLVAREIRQLVALSGLSQREFAALVGTSASRLSTYVNGLVTPGATHMLRIRRVAKLAQTQTGTGNGKPTPTGH